MVDGRPGPRPPTLGLVAEGRHHRQRHLRPRLIKKSQHHTPLEVIPHPSLEGHDPASFDSLDRRDGKRRFERPLGQQHARVSSPRTTAEGRQERDLVAVGQNASPFDVLSVHRDEQGLAPAGIRSVGKEGSEELVGRSARRDLDRQGAGTKAFGETGKKTHLDSHRRGILGATSTLVNARSGPKNQAMPRFVPLLALIAACGGASPEGSLVAQARRHSEGSSVGAKVPAEGAPATDRPAPRRAYVKREGLHIDVPYLAGRKWDDVDDAVRADQLGTITVDEELAGDERHVVGTKAELWIWRGKIYRVRKPLEHPMDIPTALGTSGFPIHLGSPVDAARDIRWSRVHNLRRLRLMKSETESTRYDALDAWAFFPKEVD